MHARSLYTMLVLPRSSPVRSKVKLGQLVLYKFTPVQLKCNLATTVQSEGHPGVFLTDSCPHRLTGFTTGDSFTRRVMHKNYCVLY